MRYYGCKNYGQGSVAMTGWIKLYRQILECEIFSGNDEEEPEPYDKRSAWIYLLLKANHKDKQIMFDGKMETIKRGQVLTSIRKLSALWQWSNDKTLRYLRKLEAYNMIKREPNTKRTLITIIKYEDFQGDDDDVRTVTSTATSTATSHKQERKEIKNISTNVDIEDEVLREKVLDWLKYKSERRESYKDTGLKSLITQIKKKQSEYGTQAVVDCINLSMSQGWKGIIWDKISQPKTNSVNFKNFDCKHNYDYEAMEKVLLGREQ